MNKNYFKQNKIFKFLAYIITIGFALLMFLPTSISLNEMFTEDTSNYISINGKEIFKETNPLYGESIADILNNQLQNINKALQSYLVIQLLSSWNKPIQSNRLEPIRQKIFKIILWKLMLELSKEEGYDLSRKNLKNFIQHSYNVYLKDLYKEHKNKNPKIKISKSDWISDNSDYYWKGFYNWARINLKNQYLHNILKTSIVNGLQPVLPEIEKEFLIDKHEVKIDFALYTYKEFIKDSIIESEIVEEKLKKFYEKNYQQLEVKRVTFTSKKKAIYAKNDIKLFKKIDNTPEKYPSTKLYIKASEKLYSQLKNYKINEISKIIKGKNTKNTFYIYKILSKNLDFNVLKEKNKKYKDLIQNYAKMNYSLFEKKYETHANKLMKMFLNKAKNYKTLIKLQNKNNKIRIGRTKFFSQNSLSIELEKNSDNKKPTLIKEFMEYQIDKGYFKYINQNFFKESFKLQKGKLSSKIISEKLSKKEKNKKVFFVLLKIDEKYPDLQDALNPSELKQYFNKIRISDYELINRFWINYFEKTKKYKIQINIINILKAFNLNIPNFNKSTTTS